MKYFRELKAEMLKDKIVILDIDGTIVSDKTHDIQIPEALKLGEIKSVARKVILVSNGHFERTKSMAEMQGVLAHESQFKKPHRKSLPVEWQSEIKDYVVVGDKFITDGLLAMQFGIPFLHVKSVQSGRESLLTKIVYFGDDILGRIFEVLRLMRPKQWIKNLLIFTPLFFAGEIFNLDLFLKSLVCFVIFSLTSSLIYIINDAKDVKEDRLHYKKRWRAIASDNLTVNESYLAAIILYAVVASLIYFVQDIFSIMILYILTNIIYTFKLKKVPVLEIVLVASMYVMRVVAGGFATGLTVSPWIIACTFFAALFLITSKRYVEFQDPVRSVLKKYTKESLMSALIISANLAITSYVIYSILGTKIHNAIYSSVFVVIVFLIILNDIFLGNKKIESPETYLITNKYIRFVILAWIVCMYILVYT